jgi:cell division inhibitor SulA/protein ImuA
MSLAALPLEAVINHPAIWRGNGCARVAIPGASTSFPELDAVFPGGGWPVAALTEIYATHRGIGEMQLLMPAAARLTRAGRWVTLIAPPYIPYAPALAAHGLQLSRLILVRAEKAEERFWACEQALRYQDCGAVLAWIDHAPERALKRLQLAAEAGNAIALLFRSARVIPASPAALRLQIERSQDRTLVRVLKRRGSSLPTPVALDFRDLPSTSAGEPAPASLPRQLEMAS